MRRAIQWLLPILLGAGGLGDIHAQWTTQSIDLRPGWNAVYLEVQPEPDDSDQVFAGLPIESVWAWNRQFTTVQFIQDVSELVVGQPDWLVHLPIGSAGRGARNLFTIRGGRPYLVKMPANSGTVNWTIKGQPVETAIDWLANSLNFVGFPLGPGSSPSFQAFFAGLPAHSGQAAYRLSAAGQWQRITSPGTTFLRAGEAYWMYSAGPSTYAGPLEVKTEQPDGLSYGRILTELTLRIRNRSAATTSITLRPLSSEPPPGPEYPWLAGDVPISFFRVDAAVSQFEWVPFPTSLERVNLPPGEEWVLRLEVNRTRMAEVAPPVDHRGVLYQGVLEVVDELGSRRLVGISAEGMRLYPQVEPQGLSGPMPLDADPGPHPRAGLWVGFASVDKVSQPAAIGDPDTPVATATPFHFRLIVHVDGEGQARLLQKVLRMFKPGTLKPDPDDPEVEIIDEPGRYVLVTDDALIPQFQGSDLRDGQVVARRISSPVFSFRAPVLMGGVGEFGGGTFIADVGTGYDDPLNPFKHSYHPDHDNLDDRFEQRLPEGRESFGIDREIELEFTSTDPERLTLPGWGDTHLGGIYRESVTGLHTRTIHASGTFRLTRVSRIGVLNDGL
jgi:hypothetical protein